MLDSDLKQPVKDEASQYYLPLPRHRRRLISHILKQITFSDCLDAGCSQHYLLSALQTGSAVKGYGCDISAKVILENQLKAPECEFQVLDIARETWSGGKQFDLVVSSEVIEHIPDWQSAVKNLAAMSKRYLLITVPSGAVRRTDQIVGHYRHFQGEELMEIIEGQGFKRLRVIKHGFPMHSLYKLLINVGNPDKLYQAFHEDKKYSWVKKFFSHCIYLLFFINYFFNSGNQLYILAERRQ